jgi:hypothetical protein
MRQLLGKQGAKGLASALIEMQEIFLCLFHSPEAAGSGGFKIHAFEKA